MTSAAGIADSGGSGTVSMMLMTGVNVAACPQACPKLAMRNLSLQASGPAQRQLTGVANGSRLVLNRHHQSHPDRSLIYRPTPPAPASSDQSCISTSPFPSSKKGTLP